MDNYPTGAKDDPAATWNQPEPATGDCPDCYGTGEVPDSFDISKKNPIQICGTCNGSGQVETEPHEPDPDSMKGGPDYEQT